MAPKRAKADASATSSRQSKRIRGQDTEGDIIESPPPSTIPSPAATGTSKKSAKPKAEPKAKAESKSKAEPKAKAKTAPKSKGKKADVAATPGDGKGESSAIQIDSSPPVVKDSPPPQIVSPPPKKSKAAPKATKKTASSTSKAVKATATETASTSASTTSNVTQSAAPSTSKSPKPSKPKSKPKSQKSKSEAGVEPKKPAEKEKKPTAPKKEVEKEKSIRDLNAVEAFDRYKDSEIQDGKEVITMEGFEKLFSDFDISFEGLKPIVFAFLCGQKEMGATLSRSEFSTGFSKLRTAYSSTQTLKDLSSSLDQVEKALLKNMEVPVEENRRSDHHQNFKNFYKWLFGFVKGSDTSQKVIPAEAATAFWSLTLESRWPVCKAFNKFLLDKAQENEGKGTGVNMDLWTQLHELCQQIGLDGAGYDEMQAWPTIFDEFVEFLRENPASQEV